MSASFRVRSNADHFTTSAVAPIPLKLTGMSNAATRNGHFKVQVGSGLDSYPDT